MDDAGLVAAARGGDRAALGALLERHRSMARALCWRLVGDAAADALQEAVLQAMLALDRLRQPARFGAWLGGIALNVCRGMLEERGDVGSWDALVGGGHHPEPADPTADPVRVAEQADLATRVRSAVDALPLPIVGERRA